MTGTSIFLAFGRRLRVPLFAAGAFAIAGAAFGADEFLAARQRMLQEIEATQREVAAYTGQRTLDAKVLAVIGDVPRHLFVRAPDRASAYENRPLSIGYGQTISQPYIVALMTDLLRVEPGDRVFELGTGSGYQAAVLARLAKEVYSVEIVAALGERAAETLARAGATNVRVRVADGYHGWPEHAPFDAIIVTAAASHVPPPLVRQLKPGGRMVIPVGSGFMTQHLMLIDKAEDGSVTTRQILPVSFVPLVGAD